MVGRRRGGAGAPPARERGDAAEWRRLAATSATLGVQKGAGRATERRHPANPGRDPTPPARCPAFAPDVRSRCTRPHRGPRRPKAHARPRRKPRRWRSRLSRRRASPAKRRHDQLFPSRESRAERASGRDESPAGRRHGLEAVQAEAWAEALMAASPDGAPESARTRRHLGARAGAPRVRASGDDGLSVEARSIPRPPRRSLRSGPTLAPSPPPRSTPSGRAAHGRRARHRAAVGHPGRHGRRRVDRPARRPWDSVPCALRT